MPIHNEEKLLSYSLPSVFRLKPDEVILIFDRCFDNSLRIAEKITNRYECGSRTQFIELSEPSPEWRFRIAFLRRYGFNLARNGVIINTDADMVLDEKILDFMPLVGKNAIGMVLFSFKPYPRTFQSFVGILVSPFAPIGFGFGGTSAFSKEAWLETEDQESAKNVPRAEDTHLVSAISRKYKTIFVKTNTLHLRQRETAEMAFLKGVNRWQAKHAPLWTVAIHSFVYLRPLVLSGYLKSRFRSARAAFRGKTKK
jgi:glycosyltransferase involved in cell wall biosynthesis